LGWDNKVLRVILLKILGCIALVWCQCLFCNIQAQTSGQPFEGKIRYALSTSGKQGKQMRTAMADEMLIYIKNKKIKCEYKSVYRDTTYFNEILIDGQDKSCYQIIHPKQIVLIHPAQLLSDSGQTLPNLSYKPTGTTAEVAGYRCKVFTTEADIPMAGGKMRITVYTTAEIQVFQDPVIANHQFQVLSAFGTSGFPLKKVYEFLETDLTITLEAFDVIAKPLTDKTFKIPKYYKREPFKPNFRLPIIY
jgi:hypothetical protein